MPKNGWCVRGNPQSGLHVVVGDEYICYSRIITNYTLIEVSCHCVHNGFDYIS